MHEAASNVENMSEFHMYKELGKASRQKSSAGRSYNVHEIKATQAELIVTLSQTTLKEPACV